MAYQTILSTSTGQMYENQLDPVRGWWDPRQLSRVVRRGATQPDGAPAAIKAGMVGFLNGNNEWVFAGIAGDSEHQLNLVPLFALGGEADYDALRVEGNLASQASPTRAGDVPTGVTLSNTNQKDVGITCLVGTGAYELGTTQIGTTAPVPGELVFAEDVTGKLDKPAASALNPFYGSAGSAKKKRVPLGYSLGVAKNQHNLSMLYFYVQVMPAA